jgi:two-component system chemotaxis response regulator CheY
MRILIADDDLYTGKSLKEFLSAYGECDLTTNGLGALDSYLTALKNNRPYHLICLDIIMPKADGIKTLAAMRTLEKEYDIPFQDRTKIIMTTYKGETKFVQTAFDSGCDAYAVKPIDTERLAIMLKKFDLTKFSAADSCSDRFTTKSGIEDMNFVPTLIGEGKNYFKSVKSLSRYQIQVFMRTGTAIYFDFYPKLNTARFGALKDKVMFNSVRTDGKQLIFEKSGKIPVKITAPEFMDLVLIDRRK